MSRLVQEMTESVSIPSRQESRRTILSAWLLDSRAVYTMWRLRCRLANSRTFDLKRRDMFQSAHSTVMVFVAGFSQLSSWPETTLSGCPILRRRSPPYRPNFPNRWARCFQVDSQIEGYAPTALGLVFCFLVSLNYGLVPLCKCGGK